MKYLAASILFAALLLSSGEAEAKRGVAIINTGDDIMEVAEIKEELRAEVDAKMPGAKIGIKYSRFGLFWMDIWRWDKSYVVVSGENYVDIEESAAKEMAAGEISKPLTLTIPPGLMVIIGLVLAFVLLMFLGRGGDDDDASDESEPEAA